MTGSAFQKKIDRLHRAERPWHQENAGKRPGFLDKPDPKTQQKIKPRDKFGV